MIESVSLPPSKSATLQDLEQFIPRIRPRLVNIARRYIASLDRRIAVPIDDIAEDVVQKVMTRTAEVFARHKIGDEQIDSFEGYLVQAVKHQCLDYFRSEARRREDFGGGSTDMAEYDDRKINRDHFQWISPRAGTPEESIADRERQTSQRAAWQYAMEQQNAYTGKTGFEKPKGMTEQDFNRGIEIIRCAMHGMDGAATAQRLQNLELLSNEYNLQDPADLKRAVDVIYQVYHRMMERMRRSMERDGFLAKLLEDLG